MKTNTQLRKYLKTRLKIENITLKELERRSGVTQGGLSMFLRGKRGISVDVQDRIAGAFVLEPWELLKKAADYGTL